MKARSLVNLCCGIVVTAAILGGLFRAQTFAAKPTPTPTPAPTATPTPTPISSNNCPAPPNTPVMTGVAVSSPTGGFAIDGDLQADTPTFGVGDWLPGSTLSGHGGSVLDSTGLPINTATTFHLIDAFSTAENNFAGGKKVDDNPNTWTWVTNPVNNKQDINHALIHFSTDANGHNWVFVSGDRLSTQGNAYIDFEFLQKTMTLTGGPTSGGFSSAGADGGRSVNDFILTLNFTGGGTTAGLCVSRWVAVGSGFDYVDATSALPTGAVFAAVNTTTIPVTYLVFGNMSYPPNAWAEAGVDLTAMLNNFGSCAGVGIKTIFVKTKESQSPTATIVDFITPQQVDIKLGPAAANAGGPYAPKCNAGSSGTTFNLHGSVAAGSINAITSMAWSVVSGTVTFNPTSCTGSNVTSCDTMATVTSSSATVRLTVTDAAGCTSTDDALLTVNANPTATISPSSGEICAGGSQMFGVNVTGGTGTITYSWTGPGGFTSSASSITVSTGGTYSVTVTDANGCSNTASANLVVDPNPTVMITGLTSCTSVTSVPVTLTANVSGGTGPFTYAWTGPGGFTSTSSSISTSTGGTYSVQVIDKKGCSAPPASQAVGLCPQ
jgi:hypothetical protein